MKIFFADKRKVVDGNAKTVLQDAHNLTFPPNGEPLPKIGGGRVGGIIRLGA